MTGTRDDPTIGGPGPMTAGAPMPCPSCGEVGDHPAAVRQGVARHPVLGEVGVTDIGWRCQSCGHEWGFEYLTDERIAR